MLLVQGSVAGNAHARACNRGVQADEEAGAGPSLEQAEQMEPSLNGPLASLAGRSYSDAGADQDISSPKRQPAVSSAHPRAEAHGDGSLMHQYIYRRRMSLCLQQLAGTHVQL